MYEILYKYKLDWNVCTCLTEFYDGRDMYIIYYIKNNYMFRHFSLAIFRLRNEKLSKQLYSTYVGCIQWGGKRRSGYEISHVLCGMGGVGTWVLILCAMSRLILLALRYHVMFVEIIGTCTLSL